MMDLQRSANESLEREGQLQRVESEKTAELGKNNYRLRV